MLCSKGFGGSPGALFEAVWGAMFGRQTVVPKGTCLQFVFLREELQGSFQAFHLFSVQFSVKLPEGC